jgi:hypothetical protein
MYDGTNAMLGSARSTCVHAAQFAVEAAITILRIDDMIRIEANPEDDMEG